MKENHLAKQILEYGNPYWKLEDSWFCVQAWKDWDCPFISDSSQQNEASELKVASESLSQETSEIIGAINASTQDHYY